MKLKYLCGMIDFLDRDLHLGLAPVPLLDVRVVLRVLATGHFLQVVPDSDRVILRLSTTNVVLLLRRY